MSSPPSSEVGGSSAQPSPLTPLKRQASQSNSADAEDVLAASKRMRDLLSDPADEEDGKGKGKNPEVRTVSLEERMEAQVTCGICQEVLWHPVSLLPCLHHFCGSCVVQWFDKSNSTCPACRVPCTSTSDSHSTNSLLELFFSLPGKNEELNGRSDEDKAEMDKLYRPGTKIKIGQGQTPDYYSNEADDYEDDDLDAQSDDGNRGYVAPPALHLPCPCCLPVNGHNFVCASPIPTQGVPSWHPTPDHVCCARCSTLVPDTDEFGRKCSVCHIVICNSRLSNCDAIAATRYIAQDRFFVIETLDGMVLDDTSFGTLRHSVPRLFNGQPTELEILQTLLRGKSWSIQDLFSRIRSPQNDEEPLFLPSWLASCTGSRKTFLAPDAPLCVRCLLAAFEVTVEQRWDDWKKQAWVEEVLSPALLNREACWYGTSCRTGMTKASHAQRLSHTSPATRSDPLPAPANPRPAKGNRIESFQGAPLPQCITREMVTFRDLDGSHVLLASAFIGGEEVPGKVCVSGDAISFRFTQGEDEIMPLFMVRLLILLDDDKEMQWVEIDDEGRLPEGVTPVEGGKKDGETLWHARGWVEGIRVPGCAKSSERGARLPHDQRAWRSFKLSSLGKLFTLFQGDRKAAGSHNTASQTPPPSSPATAQQEPGMSSNPPTTSAAGPSGDAPSSVWAPAHKDSLSVAKELNIEPSRNAVEPFRGMSFDNPSSGAVGPKDGATLPPRSFVELDEDAEMVEEPTEWFPDEDAPESNARGGKAEEQPGTAEAPKKERASTFTTGVTVSPKPAPAAELAPDVRATSIISEDRNGKKGQGTLELERTLKELVETEAERDAATSVSGSGAAPSGSFPDPYGYPVVQPLPGQTPFAAQPADGEYGAGYGEGVSADGRKIPSRQRSKSETEVLRSFEELKNGGASPHPQAPGEGSGAAEGQAGEHDENDADSIAAKEAHQAAVSLAGAALPPLPAPRKVADAPPVSRRNRNSAAPPTTEAESSRGGGGSYTAGVVRRARSSIRQEPYARAYGSGSGSSAFATAPPAGQTHGFAPPPAAGANAWLQPGAARTPYVYHSPVASPEPEDKQQDATSDSGDIDASGDYEDEEEPVVLESRTTAATIEAATRRRNPGTAARFICDLCGESFTRRYNLRGHQRAHRNEKPYACSYDGCEKSFARMHDCKRHELLHLGVRKYHCDPCQRDFVRLDALQRHHRSEVGQVCVNQLKETGYVFGYDIAAEEGDEDVEAEGEDEEMEEE